MIRILVCFKIVDNIDEILACDWENLGLDGPDTSYVGRALGCYDEAAIENALLLKDSYSSLDIPTEVTALTINPGYSDHIISAFLAIGINRIFCIEEDADLSFAPERTAALLCGFIKETGPYNVILTGSRTPPAGSGLVPLLLAEKLSLPCVSEVTEMRPVSAGISVCQELPSGCCVRQIKGNFICTIGNAKKSYLRIPTLRERLSADKTAIAQITAKKRDANYNGLKGNIVLSGFIRETEERICVFAEGDTAREMATFVYKTKMKGLLE